jgi:hypothetical protein
VAAIMGEHDGARIVVICGMDIVGVGVTAFLVCAIGVQSLAWDADFLDHRLGCVSLQKRGPSSVARLHAV